MFVLYAANLSSTVLCNSITKQSGQIVAWIAVGLLTSRISRSTAEVLLRSPQCGYFSEPSSIPGPFIARGDFPEAELSFLNYQQRLLKNANNFVQSCESSNASATYGVACDLYPKYELHREKNSTVSNKCPFAQKMCRNLTEGTFTVSTGPLDSQFDFGINTPPTDRLSVSKTLSCSLLSIEGYETKTDHAWFYDYGRSIGSNYTVKFGSEMSFSELPYHILYGRAQIGFARILTHNEQRRIRSAFVGKPTSWSSLEPLSSLNRTDADVNIIFLESNGVFLSPVYDPWFHATTPCPGKIAWPGLTYHPYWRDYWISPLGCTEQYEFCVPGTSKCTGLLSLPQIQDPSNVQRIGLNSKQMTLARHYGEFLGFVTLFGLLNSFGESYLLAYNSVNPAAAASIQLLDKQWKLEITNWLRIMRVSLQQAVLDFATGPAVKTWEQYMKKPDQGSPEHDLCFSQTTRNPKYTSFRVLGLVIIFTVGGVVIILDFLTPILHNCIRTRRNRKRNANVKDSWLLDDFFHWQQRAFEEAQIGKWNGIDDSVPVTDAGQKFKPIWYERPRQGRQSRAINMQMSSSAQGHPVGLNQPNSGNSAQTAPLPSQTTNGTTSSGPNTPSTPAPPANITPSSSTTRVTAMPQINVTAGLN